MCACLLVFVCACTLVCVCAGTSDSLGRRIWITQIGIRGWRGKKIWQRMRYGCLQVGVGVLLYAQRVIVAFQVPIVWRYVNQ